MGKFEDLIAEAVFKRFNALPKRYKPGIRSNGVSTWVPLSGIVVSDGKGIMKRHYDKTSQLKHWDRRYSKPDMSSSWVSTKPRVGSTKILSVAAVLA